MTLRTVAEAKALAKALRQTLADQGTPIRQAEALERIAHQQGARDWNTLCARLSRTEVGWHLNQRVRGRYLGQPFVGRITGLARVGQGYRVAIQLDQPVDVVKFESFSSLRRHVRGIIDTTGRSVSCTSDGQPHLLVQPLD